MEGGGGSILAHNVTRTLSLKKLIGVPIEIRSTKLRARCLASRGKTQLEGSSLRFHARILAEPRGETLVQVVLDWNAMTNQGSCKGKRGRARGLVVAKPEIARLFPFCVEVNE